MKKLLILTAVILVFCTCKKATINCGKTMSEVAGTFSFIKIEVNTGSGFIDATSILDPCALDNKIILNTNGNAEYQDAGSACSSGSGTGGSGHWTIGPDGILQLNIGTVNFSDADVTMYDCSTLVFEETDDSGGAPVIYRSTMKK